MFTTGQNNVGMLKIMNCFFTPVEALEIICVHKFIGAYPQSYVFCILIWLRFNLSTRISSSLFMGLLSSLSSPNLYRHPGLPLPRCWIWHLLLMNFMCLVISQTSYLSKSLCEVPLPSRESKAAPSLESFANLLTPSHPLSKTHPRQDEDIKENSP